MLDERRVDEAAAVIMTHVGGDDGQWREVDRQLRRIAKRRSGLDAEEAEWLLAARRCGVHRRVGCATFAEYVERVLGYTPRVCADRLRVAEALQELPMMRVALASGALAYSAVRELVRVATRETERAWIAAARGRVVREIEELVAGRQPGDRPEDPSDPDLRTRVLRFEVSPATFALFREVEQRISTHVGHAASDDEVIDAMCRAMLRPETGQPHSVDVGDPVSDRTTRSGAAADNTPPYQIALTVCQQCDRAWQDGAGRAIEVGPEVVERARCDAQLIGRVDGTGRVRASRTIPPALRRQVLRRDHQRCVVPGCRSSRWVEVHHIHERARGGANTAENLVTLCSAHHDAHHQGRLSIPTLWSQSPNPNPNPNPNPSPNPGPNPNPNPSPNPNRNPNRTTNAAVEAHDVRVALHRLGFKPWECAAAVARGLTHVGADGSLEDLIRAALREAVRWRAGKG